MTAISNVYPKVRIEAPGAPEPLIVDVVGDALRDFFREAEVWRHTSPTLLDWSVGVNFPALVAGTELPANTRIKRIDLVKYASDGTNLKPVPFYTRQHLDGAIPDWEVRTSNSPQAWTADPTPDLARLVPGAAATQAGVLQIRTIVVPTSTMTDVPNFFYDEFHDLWRFGALHRLLKMPGRDWTDTQMAAFYLEQFNDGVKVAKSRAEADYGQPKHREMSYGGIGGSVNVGYYNDYGQ